MQINIKEFIAQSGLDEPFYPGKRLVKLCPQPGEFKSHCVVYDWRDPNFIRIDIKAGLSGRDLPANDLVNYPVSFQAPTYFIIDVQRSEIHTYSSNDDSEDETDTGSKGKSSGGGKRPAQKKKSFLAASLSSFSSAVEGSLPSEGFISKMVVMGKEIAKDVYASVATKFIHQIEHAKISATDLMAAAGKLVTKFTPPAFLKPTGDEQKVYKYNREKNEVMFSRGLTPGA